MPPDIDRLFSIFRGLRSADAVAFMSSVWKTIRLELGPTPQFPTGSAGRALLVQLPLNADSEIDREAVLQSPHKAAFRRLWASDADEIGQILQCGKYWRLQAAGKPDRTLDFPDGPVRPGRRVSLVTNDGESLPLQIMTVR